MNRTLAGFGVFVLALAALLFGLRRLDRPPRSDEARPRRIVSTNRHATEILFAIGAGPEVVGVCDFCVWPPAVEELPRIGGLYDLSLDRVSELRPDLVVFQAPAKAHDESAKRLADLGIDSIAIPVATLGDSFVAIRLLGQRTGREEEAEGLVARLDRELLDVRALVSGRERRGVLVVFGRQGDELRGLTGVGPGTFLDELVATAGGTNVLADASGPYPQISAEDVLARQPDVILEIHVGETLDGARRAALRADWAPLSAVPAVAAGRIEFPTEEYLLVNGPRVPLVARRFAESIHPEVAGE